MIAYPENIRDHSCKPDLPALVEAEKHQRPQKAALLCLSLRTVFTFSDFFERLCFSGSKEAVQFGSLRDVDQVLNQSCVDLQEEETGECDATLDTHGHTHTHLPPFLTHSFHY